MPKDPSKEREKTVQDERTTEVDYQRGSNNLPGAGVMNFLSVITKHRKFISRFVVGATVLVTIVALLMPKWYKATAIVFPAPQSDLLLGLQGVSSLFRSFSPSRSLGSLVGPTEADRYAAILRSETALMEIINKYDLTAEYEITSYPREKTTKALLENLDIEFGDGGELEISVYDKDPIRAMMMGNDFVNVLNDINADLSAQNARATRAFIEERYTILLQDLQIAEDSMMAFQEKHGVVAVPEQIEVTIRSLAEVTAQLEMQKVQANVLRRTMGVDNPVFQEAVLRTQELERKITEMKSGVPSRSEEANVLIPLNIAPELAMEYVRFYRDLEIQNTILEFLTPLYEQAKVDEKRETPSVVVLSYASMPERKAKPKVSLYALITLVTTTLVSLLAVFGWEAVGRMRTLHPDRFSWVWRTMKSDWFGLRIRRNSK